MRVRHAYVHRIILWSSSISTAKEARDEARRVLSSRERRGKEVARMVAEAERVQDRLRAAELAQYMQSFLARGHDDPRRPEISRLI